LKSARKWQLTIVAWFVLAGLGVFYFGGSYSGPKNTTTPRPADGAPVNGAPDNAASNAVKIDAAKQVETVQSKMPSAEQEFQKSKNLAQFVAAMKAATTGDNSRSNAMYALALNECMAMSINPSFAETANGFGGRNIPKYMLSDYKERCQNLAQSHSIKSAEIDALYSSAAEHGDLYAQARNFAQSANTLSQEEASRQMLDIIQSGDPYAINELSTALADPSSQRLGEYAGSDASAAAWQLVACDMGMDCGAGSYIVRQMCVFGGICGQGDLRNVLAQVLSPKDFARMEQREASILKAIQAGNYQSLVH
jgi:hypothetical protein